MSKSGLFAVMYDDAAKEVFVQRFEPEAFRVLVQKEKRPDRPYPVTGFASYKAAVKEAKRVSKRGSYTYDSIRDFVD